MHDLIVIISCKASLSLSQLLAGCILKIQHAAICVTMFVQFTGKCLNVVKDSQSILMFAEG